MPWGATRRPGGSAGCGPGGRDGSFLWCRRLDCGQGKGVPGPARRLHHNRQSQGRRDACTTIGPSPGYSRDDVAPEPTRAEVPSLWRRRAVHRILFGFAAILLVTLYGIVGYQAMGWSFFDSLYQVVITISGVGFGEVRPANSTAARIHTMIIIRLGISSVAYTLGAFVQFLTESEILGYFGHQRMMRQIAALSHHTIVAGYGRVVTLV